MKFILFVIFFAAAVTASTLEKPPITTIEDLKDSGSRIISGKPAVPGQFPWQVFVKLQLSGGTSFCGGALICDRWVLTAAHCAKVANRFTLYLGSVNQSQPSEEGRVVMESMEKIVHERYNEEFLHNDIALVKLPKAVNLTDRIQPVRLANRTTGENATTTVSGWGKTSDESNTVSSTLNYVDLRTISNKECEDVYGPLVIRKETLCCRGNPEHSTCNGDSGGPLVENQPDGQTVHVGVVSFVSGRGCASGDPSGYVRTQSYLDWIKRKIGNTCKLP